MEQRPMDFAAVEAMADADSVRLATRLKTDIAA